MLVSFVTGPPCVVHSRFSTILVEGINKCMSTRATEIEAELLVLKIIFSAVGRAHTPIWQTSKPRLREIYRSL